jgi:hypothetical protein
MKGSGYEQSHVSTLLAENASTGSTSPFGSHDSRTILRMLSEIRLHFGDRVEFRIEPGDDTSGDVL